MSSLLTPLLLMILSCFIMVFFNKYACLVSACANNHKIYGLNHSIHDGTKQQKLIDYELKNSINLNLKIELVCFYDL